MTGPATLGGDPDSIRASANRWSAFGRSSAAAAIELRALSPADFIGDEGTSYRDRVSRDLLPQLDTCHEAWTQVGSALQTFANELESLRHRMSTVAGQIADQESRVAAAQTHATEVAREQAAPAAPGATPVQDVLVIGTPAVSPAQAAVRRERADLQALHAAADRIRAEHQQAVRTCCRAIDRAGQLRFTAPPGFLAGLGQSISQGWSDLCQGVDDWMDTVDWSAISGVLGMVAAVSGVLALIPVLTPIMAPIALVAGVGALATSAMGMYASGDWDLGELGLQVLGIIPGIRPALAGIRGMVAFARAAPAATAVASSAARLSATAVAQASSRADLAWDIANAGSQLGTIGITGYQATVTGQADWADVGVAALGLNIGAMSNLPRAERFQDIAQSAAGALNSGWGIHDIYAGGNTPTLNDWTGLVSSGGSLLGHSANQAQYWNGSDGPTGRTAPGEAPRYTFTDTVAAFRHPEISAAAGITRVADVVAAPFDAASGAARRLLYGSAH